MATSVSHSSPQTRPIDPDKLNALLGQAVQDMGAAMHAPLIVIGDKLGFYRAMGEGAPVTPAELASRKGTAERCVREWLNANAVPRISRRWLVAADSPTSAKRQRRPFNMVFEARV